MCNHTEKDCGHLISNTQLKKIIECTLISPYIKNEKPISLLIVAKAESGKTSTMKMYRQNKGVVYVTDCTAYGITRDILPKIVSGEVKTIMIPDLITPLSKSTKTRQSFVAFLNNLIEEGVAKITTYATVWNKDCNANVITAVTDEELRDARHNWAKIGFLSRFVLFSYSYSISTITKILNAYSEHGLTIKPVELDISEKQVEIELPKEIADKIDPIAMKIGEKFKLYGLRAKINFRSLLKALAYRNGKQTVSDEEFREFLELAGFWALKAMKQFRLGGFIVLNSSKRCYHVVFNRSVSWSENLHVVAWVSLLSKNRGILRWLPMQCIKESSTLRVSSKGGKPSPRIVFRFGKQDDQVRRFLESRKKIKKLVRLLS